MRLAVKDLFKIWSKRICSVSIVIGGMIFSQVFAWDDWDSFVWDDWDNMGMVDFSEHTVIAAQKFTDVSPVWTKTMGYINQLSGVTEPQDAYGRNAFRNIIKIGADAVEPLKVAAQDLSMNTDARKWALYLLGETASKEQAGEVRDFLLGVMNSAGGRYDWWHRAEAKNGLQRLYERFPKLEKSSNQEIEVEKTANLINNLSGWGGTGLSVRDRLPVDFLPTKRVY